MLFFGHQTFFNLCMALLVLTAVSVVCASLLFIERQNIEQLQQNLTDLREENATLRSKLKSTRKDMTGISAIDTNTTIRKAR